MKVNIQVRELLKAIGFCKFLPEGSRSSITEQWIIGVEAELCEGKLEKVRAEVLEEVAKMLEERSINLNEYHDEYCKFCAEICLEIRALKGEG